MTRSTSARLAGGAFLLYIAAGIASLVLFGGATRGDGATARLARIAEHATDVRLSMLLTLIGSFCALVLGVTLYTLTRDEDHDLAMLAMVCRVAEGVIGGMSVDQTLGLLWLATADGAAAPTSESAQTLGAFLLGQRDPTVTATFFAVGSTIFSWLLLKGRLIPVTLAWLGMASSVLLVVVLPLQLAGVLRGAVTQLVWAPMAAFEIALAVLFLFRGVAAPARRAPHVGPALGVGA